MLACHAWRRTKTTPERRGVETALDQWRLGADNWRNVYIGTRHVGVIWESGLPEQVVAAMNGDPDRDERLRAEGRRQADNAINWGTACLGCADRLDSQITERHAGADEAAREIEAEIMAHFDRTGDSGVREAATLVWAYIARGLQRYVEPPGRPDGHTGTSEPPQALSAGPAGHAADGSAADQPYGRLCP
jgi:hypothetical protein